MVHRRFDVAAKQTVTVSRLSALITEKLLPISVGENPSLVVLYVIKSQTNKEYIKRPHVEPAFEAM